MASPASPYNISNSFNMAMCTFCTEGRQDAYSDGSIKAQTTQTSPTNSWTVPWWHPRLLLTQVLLLLTQVLLLLTQVLLLLTQVLLLLTQVLLLLLLLLRMMMM
jgi:hypothetical protein